MRKLLALTLTLLLTVPAVIPAMAAEQPALNPAMNGEVVYGPGGETTITRAEEFAWYVRNIYGYPEKRLWSITYGYWVTDWMPA